MNFIQATSVVLQGTLYTLGSLNGSSFLWAGDSGPVLQEGLCDQPQLFEYKSKLLAMCQTPSLMFLGYSEGFWKPDLVLNQNAPPPRIGSSITKMDEERLVLLGGGIDYKKTNEVYQFNSVSWDKISYLSNQSELPAFAHHSATMANDDIVVASTEGIFRLETILKKWSKISDSSFDNGHSATFLKGLNCIAFIDSTGLKLLGLNDFHVKERPILEHEIKRVWHGASFFQGKMIISFGSGALAQNSKISIDPATWKATSTELELPNIQSVKYWGTGATIVISVIALVLVLFGCILLLLGLRRQTSSNIQATPEDFCIVPQQDLPPLTYPWGPQLPSSSSSSIISKDGTLV